MREYYHDVYGWDSEDDDNATHCLVCGEEYKGGKSVCERCEADLRAELQEALNAQFTRLELFIMGIPMDAPEELQTPLKERLLALGKGNQGMRIIQNITDIEPIFDLAGLTPEDYDKAEAEYEEMRTGAAA